jgi:hypothetical protein
MASARTRNSLMRRWGRERRLPRLPTASTCEGTHAVHAASLLLKGGGQVGVAVSGSVQLQMVSAAHG